MTALLVLLFCKVAAVGLVGGLLWLLVPLLIEEWRNPPKHWTWYANQQFQQDLERTRQAAERRQKLLDQL